MATAIPRGEHVPTADHRVVMHDITWDGYETLLALRGERSSPRMTYLDGVVEIMSKSWDHERIARRIGELLGTYTFEAWFWDAGAIVVYRLGAVGYLKHERSTFVPELDLRLICDLIELPSLVQAKRTLIDALRR